MATFGCNQKKPHTSSLVFFFLLKKIERVLAVLYVISSAGNQIFILLWSFFGYAKFNFNFYLFCFLMLAFILIMLRINKALYGMTLFGFGNVVFLWASLLSGIGYLTLSYSSTTSYVYGYIGCVLLSSSIVSIGPIELQTVSRYFGVSPVNFYGTWYSMMSSVACGLGFYICYVFYHTDTVMYFDRMTKYLAICSGVSTFIALIVTCFEKRNRNLSKFI